MANRCIKVVETIRYGTIDFVNATFFMGKVLILLAKKNAKTGGFHV